MISSVKKNLGNKGVHSHNTSDFKGNRLLLAIVVNVLLTVVQIVGGIISGSLALIADAIHNLSDAGSLLVALIARRIARRPADETMTFGYRRAEVIGALINFTTLIIIGLYLIYEAIVRFFVPEPIAGWIVVIVASVALIIDISTALLTYTLSKESMNVRAAFLHNVADALASVGVIVAGTLIILFDWGIVDLIATVIIAGYVLYHGFTEIGGAIRILMSGVSVDGNFHKTVKAMEAIEGVCSVHHLHLWAMDEHQQSLEAHVVVNPNYDTETVKMQIKDELKDRFNITHSTLEIELHDDSRQCQEKDVLGH
ncbi:MAG: cation transporter [Chloroflexi bacterium]|nr:MAG: cation transporter [Chloroflexota bacterium]